MATERWQRIEELFHATLQLEAAERAGYLLSECVGDEVLRREVESLITASENSPAFIDAPALSLGMRVLSDGVTEFPVGRSIGHYKIIRLLGRGGMGEVYLAEDCKLERQVALKFIGNDLWAKDQLISEARVIARLENPNICAVYGVEEVAEHNFIVMQYVEGETLAALLSRGPLAGERALDYSEQIVSALAAAHLRGIIHRDVKPQNMIVTAEGQIKVLDFGLAKFVQQNPAAELPSISQNQTSHLGFVIGTVAYMSPEQTQGQDLDCRSDIFSFGIVLYQMLSGKNPFLHETKEETISALNEAEPAPLPPDEPGSLAEIARKCLEKEQGARFETSEQLLLAFRSLRAKQKKAVSIVDYLQGLSRHRYFKLYTVAAIAAVLIFCAAASFIYVKAKQVHTLALLPIKNQSSDPSKDYISAGLTRNLFDKFSYLPRLKVKMPTEVPANGNAEIVQVGRELNVEAVLVGEILKQGEVLQLRLSMLNTSDGQPRWEQTFDVDAVNMFELQDEITHQVTSSLGLWLIGNDKKLLSKHQTDNEEALRLYMHGRYYWSLKRDRENIQTAISNFERAVALDPAFAQAYTGLADCYVLMTNVLYGPMQTKEAIDKARYNAGKALEIDPSLPEAHTSMGVIRHKFDWNWQEAEREFKLAIDLDPEYAPAHYGYANLLVVLGRFDEAIKQSEVSRSLDPYSRLSAMNYGRTLYYSRRFDDAAAHFGDLLKEEPDYAQYLHMMGLVLIQQRRYPEAIATLERLHSKDPLHTAAALGYAYGKAGRHSEALRMVEELDKFSQEKPVSPHEKALVYIGLGDRDEAFPLLEKAYQERFPNLVYLTTDPIYDDLRADPRFNDLARRINLAP